MSIHVTPPPLFGGGLSGCIPAAPDEGSHRVGHDGLSDPGPQLRQFQCGGNRHGSPNCWLRVDRCAHHQRFPHNRRIAHAGQVNLAQGQVADRMGLLEQDHLAPSLCGVVG